jgi:hypothetical protein
MTAEMDAERIEELVVARDPGDDASPLAEVLTEMGRASRELHSRAQVTGEAVRRARRLLADGKPNEALDLLTPP